MYCIIIMCLVFRHEAGAAETVIVDCGDAQPLIGHLSYEFTSSQCGLKIITVLLMLEI